MKEYMTKDEYKTFMRLQDMFSDCLERCGIEIFLMEHNRKPVGEFCEEYELYEFDDRYMVQFETYSCGESDRDTVYVPVMYIHDSGYREYYNTLLEKRKREKEVHKEAEKQKTKDDNDKAMETYDRAEYERLKKKDGDI